MFCSGCGGGLDEADAFCRKCGKPKTDAGVQPAPNPVSIQNPYRGKNKQIIGVIVLILGIILMLIAYGEESVGFAVFGALVGLGGVVTVVIGKAKHWYHAE